ncbi:MAG: aldose 1-epimerase family protein [Saprospiraceae bacterium]|nr:aldose 1-epimerase family protein [Saprospiraceae bacterium]
MALHYLENDILIVEINTIGAELQRIYNKKTNLEYLWHGDPAHWGSRAPILFPIVGRLKNNTYHFNGKSYEMPQHGFARKMEFEVEKKSYDTIQFLLKSTDDTKKMFPFDFELRLGYRVDQNILIAGAEICNPSENESLLCSIGFHPAFNVPLVSGTSFDDYLLEFNKDESAESGRLEDGSISDMRFTAFEGGEMPLQYKLFEKDALLFWNLKSDVITLKSNKTDHGLQFRAENFPFYGIWTKPNAPYVCLEPWHGIADNLHRDGNIETKEGIMSIPEKTTFSCQYEVKCY